MVRFPRLRPDLFNEGVLKCLCQPFGRFLDSDYHTKQRTRCAFARCCVEVDIAKALPPEIWIETGDGHGWWQEVIYEGNLKYCSKCKLHGHNLSECRKMRPRAQGRVEEQREPLQGKSKDLAEKVPQQQTIQSQNQNNNQEWIQVQRKKSRPDIKQNIMSTERNPEGKGKIHSPILVDEEDTGEVMETEPEATQEQTIPNLKKSISESNLLQQGKEKISKPKEFLTRSHSLNDIPMNLSERRLEYIQEEFQHYHLIHKHLQKTKVETLARLKLMEERKKQILQPQEDSQQSKRVSDQEESVSIVPETQMDSNQVGEKGGNNQKKKQAFQSASKPLTRAAKKQISPKKK